MQRVSRLVAQENINNSFSYLFKWSLEMLTTKYLSLTFCVLSLAFFAISWSSVESTNPTDAELERVFGEGIPNTVCKVQAACKVPNTCTNAGPGLCAGDGGCSGPQNRVCGFGGTAMCTQIANATCCAPQGCRVTRTLNGSQICVPDGFIGLAKSGVLVRCL